MTEFEDSLPVQVFVTEKGETLLLDRHNDLMATFERTLEPETIVRIIEAVNAARAQDVEMGIG